MGVCKHGCDALITQARIERLKVIPGTNGNLHVPRTTFVREKIHLRPAKIAFWSDSVDWFDVS